MNVRKLTYELSHIDLRELQTSRDHARKINRPLDTHITWHQFEAMSPSPAARSKEANRFLSHLRTWSRRHFGDFTALWVWHADPSGRNPHLHVFMHLPKRLRDELHRALQAKYPAGVIDVRKGTYICERHPSGYLGSTFDYITRFKSQKAYVMQGGKAWRASRRDAAGKHVGIKTPIVGKRWGCTRNINRNAVEAYWERHRLITANNGSREVA